MTKALFSIGHLASELHVSVQKILQIAAVKEIEPEFLIDGVPHFDAGGRLRLEAALASGPAHLHLPDAEGGGAQ